LRVDLAIDPQLLICAPPSALQVLVNNLMGNALVHGSDYLHLQAGPDHLQLVNGLDPGIDIHSGFGYGLGIVQRLCTHCGWRLTITRELARFVARVEFS
jgi:hypothetical protein